MIVLLPVQIHLQSTVGMHIFSHSEHKRYNNFVRSTGVQEMLSASQIYGNKSREQLVIGVDIGSRRYIHLRGQGGIA